MHLAYFIGLIYSGEKALAEAFASVAQKHVIEPEIHHTCQKLSAWSAAHAETLLPFLEQYQAKEHDEPEQLRETMFSVFRLKSFGLIRDLQNLWVLVNELKVSGIILLQAAYSLRDQELITVTKKCNETTDRQLMWLLSQIKHLAPQVLVLTEE